MRRSRSTSTTPRSNRRLIEACRPLLEPLENRVLLAADLLLDINALGGGGLNLASEVRTVGSTVFFTADDGTNGLELWQTDGTSASLVKDINPTGSSTPKNLTAVGTKLFFTADDGTNGRELWVSDGTDGGTFMVKDINDTPGVGSLDTLFGQRIGVAVGSTFYFMADDGVNGVELWSSDGTSASMVADINAFGDGIFPFSNFIGAPLGSTLFFVADDGTGSELWSTDGTTTAIVFDINASGGSGIYDMAASGSNVFFAADDGVVGFELWRSDGTTTELVKDILPGGTFDSSFPFELTDVGGTLFFTADDGVNGLELWTSDGTELGTVMVKDIMPTVDPFVGPTNLRAADGLLYFMANDEVNGFEPWVSNGTEAGTFRLADVNVGGDSNPFNFTAANGNVFFVADDGVNGLEMWVTNGTEAGTMLLKDINPSGDGIPLDFTFIFPPALPSDSLGATFYFVADDGGGLQLWKSDGTETGTTKVGGVGTGTPSSVDLSIAPLVIGTTLYFVADDGINGNELWMTDGTPGGTTLVSDINLGGDSNPGELTNVNGTLFFTADDGAGRDVWMYDGVTLGNIGAGADPIRLTAAGSLLFFVANNGAGSELAAYDGVSVTAFDINSGLDSSNPMHLAAFGSSVYFSANDVGGTNELWRSDGTSVEKVLDTGASPVANPTNLTAANGRLYFAANSGSEGNELWSTDGTTTALLQDINPAGSSNPSNLTNVGGILYFAADDGTHGNELWSSDGTTTALVKDINVSSDSSNPSNLTDVAGTLYFVADDGSVGRELWISDGTEDGTVLAADIKAGPDSSDPSNLTAVNGVLFFSADPPTGVELWMSKGTPASTVLVSDINPGPGSSDPHNLTNFNGVLFLSADNGTVGREPYLATVSNISGRVYDDVNGNGIDDGEPGVGGILVFLDDGNGIFEGEPSTTTNSNGQFTFANLDVGTYLVRVMLPSGVVQTTADPAGITLNGGVVEDVTGVDFGTFTTFSISGHVFEDTDGEGDDDEGLVLANVTVFIDDNGNGELDGGESLVMTDANGNYTFSNLGPGSYLIRAVPPANATLTTNLPAVIEGVSGLNVTDVDFGFQIAEVTDPVVEIITDPCNPARTALRVIGTSAADNILFAKPAKGGGVEVFIDGVSKGIFNPTGRILAYGEGGADRIEVSKSITLAAILYGGQGNDTIVGGNGSQVLLGGDDNDELIGGNGRDLLIGGSGADVLKGFNGDDILVAGSTAHDDDLPALCALLDEWSRTDKTYAARINSLTNGGGLNGSFKLNTNTVFSDSSLDQLFGGKGSDWFLADDEGEIEDSAKNEVAVVLD